MFLANFIAAILVGNAVGNTLNKCSKTETSSSYTVSNKDSCWGNTLTTRPTPLKYCIYNVGVNSDQTASDHIEGFSKFY